MQLKLGIRSNELAGVVFAALLVLSAFLSSCRDQPIDPDGSAVADTQVVVRYDTVVVGDTDTIVITHTDTIIVEKYDTIRSSRIDTVEIHDTVIVRVPVMPRFRKAILMVKMRNDYENISASPYNMEFDVTRDLEYSVTLNEASGEPISLRLNLNARALTPEDRFSAGPEEYRFYLRGLQLDLPGLRLRNQGSDSLANIDLIRHPNSNLGSGMLLITKARQDSTLNHFWTGQELNFGDDSRVNEGRFKVEEIDRDENVILARVDAKFYVPVIEDQRGELEEFPIRIYLQLGY